MAKARLFKKLGTCPICDGVTKLRYLAVREAGHRRWTKVRCLSDICRYAFFSSDSVGSELIGFVNIAWSLDVNTEPGFDKIIKRWRRLKKLRERVVQETRTMLSDPEARIMFECFLSPNANKHGLSLRMLDWLYARADKFPINFDAIKSMKEIYDRNKAERENRENPDNLDDNQQDGPSSGG